MIIQFWIFPRLDLPEHDSGWRFPLPRKEKAASRQKVRHLMKLFWSLIKWPSDYSASWSNDHLVKHNRCNRQPCPFRWVGSDWSPVRWWEDDLDDDPVSPACSVSVSSLQCIALPSRCTSQHLWRRVTTQRYFFFHLLLAMTFIEGWILSLISKRSHALSFSFDEFADVSQMFRSRPESLEPACRLLNARLWLCLHPNPEAFVFIMMLPPSK